ncbi:MAG: hypothetical protein WC378_11330 [Opitutaceae bacterium]|jgi:hypothetical protein
MTKPFIQFLAFLAFLTAAVYGGQPLAIPQYRIDQKHQELGRWLAIGPFEAAKGEQAIEIDFLARIGNGKILAVEGNPAPGESNQSARSLEALANEINKSTRSGDASAEIVSFQDFVDFNQVYGINYSHGVSQVAVYALCEIISDQARNAWLAHTSDDGSVVWLNGEQCYIWPGRSSVERALDAIPLKLRAGKNLLMVKVANFDGGWALKERLEPDLDSAAEGALSIEKSVLKHTVIPEGAALELTGSALPEKVRVEAVVEDFHGVVIRKLSLARGEATSLVGMPRGLYRLKFPLLGTAQSGVLFAIGDVAWFHRTLKERCDGVPMDDRGAINTQAYLRRLDILSRPFQSNPTDDSWAHFSFMVRNEEKAVYAATRLTDILDRMAAHEEPFRQRPGLHLRGFRSKIDDQVMHYRLYIPQNFRPDGPPLPLVISMQTVFKAERPYLESSFVAAHGKAENWGRIAERLGVAVLWPGYRVCPYGNPADIAHFDEVLATVKQDYRIDESRVYLHGECSAGMTTAMELARHPSHYAAAAFINPVLHRLKNRFDDGGEYASQPAYRRWLAETDPVECMAAIKDLPVWIIHDSADPDHGPLSHSVDYFEMARALGNHPRLDIGHPPGPPRMQLIEKQLAWLVQHKRSVVKENAPEDDTKEHDGPLSRAFAERIVLVTGTGGSQAEKEAAQSWSAAFRAAWKKTNYVDCRAIEDVELAETEEAQSNLVLIGNETCNTIWKKLAGERSIVVAPGEVSVGGRKWTGGNLAVQAWERHPKHPERRIVLIGAADLEKSGVGTMELALDGWFDFAVWKKEGGRAVLVYTGRYEK